MESPVLLTQSAERPFRRTEEAFEYLLPERRQTEAHQTVQLIKLPRPTSPLPPTEKSPRQPLLNSHSLNSLSPATPQTSLFTPSISRQTKLNLIGSERRKSFTAIQFDETSRVKVVQEPSIRHKSTHLLVPDFNSPQQSISSFHTLASVPPLQPPSLQITSPVHNHLTTTLPYISDRTATTRTTIVIPTPDTSSDVHTPPTLRRAASPIPFSATSTPNSSPQQQRRRKLKESSVLSDSNCEDAILKKLEDDGVVLSSIE